MTLLDKRGPQAHTTMGLFMMEVVLASVFVTEAVLASVVRTEAVLA